jgi:NAD(P)-dependent dehydrogenase (short-subunit alcohol dehydrogenase family)
MERFPLVDAPRSSLVAASVARFPSRSFPTAPSSALGRCEVQAAEVVWALRDVSATARVVSSEGSKAWRAEHLVNCAEMGGEKAFADLTAREGARMIGVHLRDTFLVTHAFFADMVARGYGRIILISSQLAYKGVAGLAHYCAAKAGIVGFTWALSYEGAPHNVMVNAIAPGPFETDTLATLSDDRRAIKMVQLPTLTRSCRPRTAARH